MVSFSFLNAVDPTTIVFIVLLVVLIVALLVVPMFTNKKRAKQTEELHRSLQPGDLIKTVGGIIGTIKEIRQVSPVDREMVIETGEGDNKTTMVFDIQALYQVMSRNNTAISEEINNDTATTAPETESDTAEPVAVVDDKPVAVDEKADVNVESDVKEEAKDASVDQEQAAVSEPVSAEKPETENKPKAAAPAKKKPVNSAKKTGATKNEQK